MSCEVKHIARFADIKKYRQSFLETGVRKDDGWIQESIVSLSPTGEMLVLAKGTYVVVFSSKWVASADGGDMKMEFDKIWEGHPSRKSGDITSVFCLPLLSTGQSASGTDWTCIIIGYSSGTITFHTENMARLLSEVLHAEPILHIKCNSFRTASQRGTGPAAEQEPHEAIYVLYKSVICDLNVFSLFQTLRGCRNRLARESALLFDMPVSDSFPIDFKKYGFADQDAITDASFIGQTSINVFDHLVTASLAAGFKCNYRQSPPQTSLIVATGRKPFLGFHYTMEGGDKWSNMRGSAVLAGVAMAVGSKIKDSVAASLPGWFAFGSSEPETKKVSQEPAEQLRCRFGLCDLWRHSNSIVTSPDCRFSATTDSLGRIFLIENSTGLARRLWKGYREAQCGFLEVEEDVEKSRRRKTKTTTIPRRVLFIVIYAPKKGLIEIFGIQQGPCVASFKVSKNGQLIYTPHGLLGFNNHSKGMNASQYPVTFLSEEGIMEVIVPFHCGLRSDNSNKARDLHILKKMKLYLKEDHSDENKFDEDMKSFAKDLKTEEIKTQVVEMLMVNKSITARAFMSVLNEFIDSFKKEDDDNRSLSFLTLVESLEKLLAFYVFLRDLKNQPPNYKKVVESDESESHFADKLLLSSKDVTSITELINKVGEMERKKKDTKVSFAEKKEKELTQFISCFNINDFVVSVSKTEKHHECYIHLKSDLSDEKMRWIGEFLFGGIFYSDDWLNDWKTYVTESRLARIDLMKSLLAYWFEKNVWENMNSYVLSLLELTKAVCSLMDPEEICVDYNKSSPWWIAVRSYITKSQCSFPVLLAAIACRAASITVEQMKEMRQIKCGKKQNQDEEESHSNEWENVSKDTWEWDILISNLEDLIMLNSVLNLSFENFDSTRPKLDFHPGELSLKFVLSKGDGYVSELVAKWLTQFGLEPTCLIDMKDVEFQVKKTPTEEKGADRDDVTVNEPVEVDVVRPKVENETVQQILDYLDILKGKFPYSLTSSSLLGNIFWEYIAYWYKNPEELSCLESAVDYLLNIPSSDLKHGLSYLGWTTYISKELTEVTLQINALGKLLKKKLFCSEVRLTEVQVPVFFKLCSSVLNAILETSNTEKKEFVENMEGIWQNKLLGNCQSLVRLALSQPKPNDELVVLHYQLSMSMYMMTELNIKFPQILSKIFDSDVKNKLFINLSKDTQMSIHSFSPTLTQARKQFLYKVIAGAVQTIEVVENILPFSVADSPEYVPETRVSVEKATKWLSHCYDMARMWDIPLDDLRRHYVCELYSCGFDRLAEEILPSVNECDTLASQLLVLASMRLKVHVMASSSLSKKLSNLNPNLTTWLECLDCKNLKNHTVDLKDLRIMMLNILKWSKSEEERLALEMAECIPPLDEEDTL